MKGKLQFALVGILLLLIGVGVGVWGVQAKSLEELKRNVDQVQTEVAFEPYTVYVPTQDKVIVAWNENTGKINFVTEHLEKLDLNEEIKVVEERWEDKVTIFNGYNSFVLDINTGDVLSKFTASFSPWLDNPESWSGWTRSEISRTIEHKGTTEYWTYGTGTETIQYTEDMLDEEGEILSIKSLMTVEKMSKKP